MINRIIEANPLTWLGNWLFSKSSLLSKLTQYFSQLLIGSTATNTRNALFLLGVAGISYLTLKSIYNQYKFWSFVPKHQRNAKEFSTEAYKQRYGDCYVLITGAADGIGYAYSREFCRMGFNIIMADIQEQKLAFKKDELKAVYPNCRIQTYVVNMSEQKAIDSFIENIKNYDIGIVVNNVGVSGGGAYLQIDTNIMKRTLFVNYRPMYELNKHILPKLRTRAHRSAIINMSSCTGRYLSPMVGTYAGIKRAVDLYTQTLAIQNRDKIDVLSVMPFGVTTGMVRMNKTDRTYITPKQCAVSALRDLGKSESTFSGFNHKMFASFFQQFSEYERFQIYEDKWKANRK